LLNILLIWLLAFIGKPDQSSPTYFCRQYEMTLDSSSCLLTTEPIKYSSTFERTYHKHFLTIKTDSVMIRFAVLRTYTIPRGFQTFAIIPGEPEQLYVIHEFTHGDTYYFTYRPVKQYNRTINGKILEISNKEIK
jgi:hypothetical protein